MKTLACSTLIAFVLMGLSAGGVRGEDREADRLNSRVHEVNDAAKKKGMMPVALNAVSVETGVPREQVEELHKRFSDVGPAGLLLSCVLAAETKKQPEYFAKKHNSGDGWGTIARDNKVSPEKLIERLDHVDRALASGTEPRDKDKRRKS
jgi:molybdenum cofactor biosynthesis enzyme MoaA